MRKNFLKEHRRGIYQEMILTGELKAHCLQVQEQAEQRMELLTGQMAKSEGVNEELKAADQMGWVAKMNNIRHSAEERSRIVIAIHHPVLFRIKPKISQSFKRESYVLIITLSIKDRRLRDISSQSRMRFYRRSI